MGKWATYQKRGGGPAVPYPEIYFAAITAAGGSIDAQGKAAIYHLYTRLTTSGLWPLLLEIWPCVGSNLAACMVKFKVWPGAPASYTNTNFLEANFNQSGASGGLVGDGATKSLANGPTLTDLGLDASISFSVRAVTPAAANRFYAGVLFGTAQAWLGSLTGTATNSTRIGATTIAADANPMNAAFWTGSRTSSTSLVLYRDGVSIASSATVTALPVSTFRCRIFAGNSAGSTVAIVPARLCGGAFGRGLASGEAATLRTIWEEFNAMLSR